MILSSLPVVSTDTKMLPYADCWHSARGAVHAAIDVNGVTAQVYGVHLQTGSCTDTQTGRLSAVAALESWASRSASPHIVAGDFNAVTGSPEISDTTAGMASMFADTWITAGAGSSNTYPLPSPTMKIDFWFEDASGKARAVASRVETGATESDHYPLSASFLFRR
jgi:endonuclease/exonuclease/phosphatase family metal-dependent hydrolase